MAAQALSSIAAPRRLRATQRAHDAQRLCVARTDGPHLRSSGSPPREAENPSFSGLQSLFLSQSEQSSTQNASWGKVREPSFESNIGGVGPVVAGALDRSRRLISTAAAASDGAVQICKEYPYECKETPYT